jgi:hypothetical protein
MEADGGDLDKDEDEAEAEGEGEGGAGCSSSKLNDTAICSSRERCSGVKWESRDLARLEDERSSGLAMGQWRIRDGAGAI